MGKAWYLHAIKVVHTLKRIATMDVRCDPPQSASMNFTAVSKT